MESREENINKIVDEDPTDSASFSESGAISLEIVGATEPAPESEIGECENSDAGGGRINVRSRIAWSLVFVALAVLSVWAVVSQSKDFSLLEFAQYIRAGNPLYLALSVLSMLSFIVFEGIAIVILCRSFGYKRGVLDGFFYSSADIYFSAITPSATGGQPASAYLMMRDGMSGLKVTVILLANLIMYTLSIIAIGLFSFIVRPQIFMSFGIPSRVLIILGCFAQVCLAIFFFLLIRKERLVFGICKFFVRMLCAVHIIKNPDKWMDKLNRKKENYSRYSSMISKHRKTLLFVFLFNLIQRASQITVTMFAYLATGGAVSNALDVWVMQSYAVLGSNSMPVPGAMGVLDYLLLDAFGSIMPASETVKLELLSRGISFYSCIIICGIAFLISLLVQRKRRNQK